MNIKRIIGTTTFLASKYNKGKLYTNLSKLWQDVVKEIDFAEKAGGYDTHLETLYCMRNELNK